MTTTTTGATRTTARSWLSRLLEKTHATREEAGRMLGVTAEEVGRILDETEAEPLASETEAAVMRVLVSGGKLSTAASFEWTTAQP